MTPSDRLRRLFDFDVWANLKVLAVLEDHSSYDREEKTLSIFYHIIGTQHIWYARITGAELLGVKVWPEYELGECRKLIESNYKQWHALIDENEDDPDRIISYKNTSGVAFETMLSDILHHVVIHGQHHRAQIATLLRMADIAPPPTDFIFYTRHKNR